MKTLQEELKRIAEDVAVGRAPVDDISGKRASNTAFDDTANFPNPHAVARGAAARLAPLFVGYAAAAR